LCADEAGNEGSCAIGPDDSYCDAIVRANGEGYLFCQSNADCSIVAIGIPAGNCTQTRRRSCFPSPIETTGVASTTDPLLVAAFCVAPGTKPSENQIVGWPGPVREKLQVSTVFPCPGAPAQSYPDCP
jgi:hypothetical protein